MLEDFSQPMIPGGLSDTYRKCNIPKSTYTNTYVEAIHTCIPIFVLIDKHTRKYRSALQPVLSSFRKIFLFYAKYRIDV